MLIISQIVSTFARKRDILFRRQILFLNREEQCLRMFARTFHSHRNKLNPSPPPLYSLKNMWVLSGGKNLSASVFPRFVETDIMPQEEREKYFPLAPLAV